MGVAFVRAPSEDASEESKGDVRKTAGKKEPGVPHMGVGRGVAGKSGGWLVDAVELTARQKKVPGVLDMGDGSLGAG